MSDVVRWGILGNAMIARDFMIPAMEASDLCQVTAVASRTAVPASIAPHAKHYDSYEALLHDPEVDAVYVPVPNALHEKWSIEAMRCGKHVLCEKPMACTAAAGERMLRAAEDNRVLLMEAFMYRYGEPFRKMMQIVSDGTIGPIAAMYGCHGYTLDWASPAREKAELGGGSIYAKFLPYCQRAIVTVVDAEAEADTYFPNLDRHPDWELLSTSEPVSDNGYTFCYREYIHK